LRAKHKYQSSDSELDGVIKVIPFCNMSETNLTLVLTNTSHPQVFKIFKIYFDNEILQTLHNEINITVLPSNLSQVVKFVTCILEVSIQLLARTPTIPIFSWFFLVPPGKFWIVTQIGHAHFLLCHFQFIVH
jgi:hypothetical protein